MFDKVELEGCTIAPKWNSEKIIPFFSLIEVK